MPGSVVKPGGVPARGARLSARFVATCTTPGRYGDGDGLSLLIDRAGLQFLILTAVRPGNVAAARFEDIADGMWTIPAEAMKAGRVHRVPLAAAAIELVEAARAFQRGRTEGLIFARRPLLRMCLRRMGRAETPHGFRSSFKEWSLSAGWPDHLSELALAHTDADAVRAAYARSDVLDERRPMMAAWAAHVAG